MKVQHIVNGEVREMELDITGEQLARWHEGELVQDVFPHLSPDEREFLLTGMTAEEWDELFKDEEQ